MNSLAEKKNSFGLEFLEEMKPVEITDIKGASSVCTTQSGGDGGAEVGDSGGCSTD
jgi:hypothetical protein